MSPDQRLDELEDRLSDYHERLIEAIQQRDRLALDAAWGVHYALHQNVANLMILGGVYIAFDQGSWLIGGIVAAACLFGSHFAIFAWSNRQRMKEVERLEKLPAWEWKIWDP